MKLLLPREELHRKVYLFVLLLLAFSIPLNRYLVSIPKYLLILNWLLEGNLRQKMLMIRKNYALLIFSSIFVLYAVGCFFSANVKAAFEMVNYAQTLLVIPVIIGTSAPLSGSTIKQLLLVFAGSVLIASLLCAILYLVNGLPPGGDFRSISVFKPHNRFTLEVIMAIFIVLYFSAIGELAYPGARPSEFCWNLKCIRPKKVALFAVALILVAFLLFFKSLTGLILFVILAFILALRVVLQTRQKIIRYGVLFFMVVFVLGISAIIRLTWQQNFLGQPADPGSLEKFTVNGNPYTHNTTSGIMENGHFADIYICEDELRTEWNKMSAIAYDKSDIKGQPISTTLKRYLTSKGLRKDSAALHSLGAADLLNIQQGLANYRFHVNPSLYQRIYETLWEIHVIINAGYVQHHSFTQRLIFMKIACRLIRENPWTGVGPGDVCDAMTTHAASENFTISELWIGKPHNQFAFYMLAFGIPGFLWIAFCWIFPVITSHANRFLLFNLFTGIILLSMLTLDTLESYDSITFVAFFYSLFAFGFEKQKKT